MQPLTESQLRSSLANASGDVAEHMTLPGMHEILWEQRDYLGWRDSRAAARAYLVCWREGRPVGLLLRVATNTMRPGVLAMCSLCGTQQPAGHVALFTAPLAGEAGERGSTVGTYLCDDFSCSLTIRNAAASDLQPSSPELVGRRVDALRARLDGFVGRVLRG